MKNFYFACSKTENGRCYAWVLKIPENHNIIKRILPDHPDVLHPCHTKRDAEQIVNYWNACYKVNNYYLFDDEIPAAPQEPEENPPKLCVCERCLMAIESREGQQITRKIYLDEDDPRPCDWCEDTENDVLYELL